MPPSPPPPPPSLVNPPIQPLCCNVAAWAARGERQAGGAAKRDTQTQNAHKIWVHPRTRQSVVVVVGKEHRLKKHFLPATLAARKMLRIKGKGMEKIPLIYIASATLTFFGCWDREGI